MLTIYFLAPFTLGAISSYKIQLGIRFQESYTKKYLNNKIIWLQLILSAVVFISSVIIIIVATLHMAGLLEKAILHIRQILIYMIAAGSISAFILLYHDLKLLIISLLKKWEWRITLSLIIFLINTIANSYSQNQIEAITGYSSTNFHSTEDTKWLFTVLFSVILVMYASLIFIFYYQLKYKIQEVHYKSRIENHIQNNIISPVKMFSCVYFYLVPILVFEVMTMNLSYNFNSIFVVLNFHQYTNECKNIQNGSNVAILSKNNIDDATHLIATKTNEVWTYKGVICD